MDIATTVNTDTTFKTFEVSIPDQYVSAIRTLVKSLGGKIKVHKEKSCGLDKALEEVKQGNVSKVYRNMDEMWKDLMA